MCWWASTALCFCGWSSTGFLRGTPASNSSNTTALPTLQLILGGQWWRLLTAIFVHVGLLHIATNMWCLWNLGLLGEPLLGPFGLAAVYVLTGVAGNLLSLAYNVSFRHPEAVGAGASGAVFGIAGILIVLLSNHKLPIPWCELQRLRRSVIQFAGLNLVIGIAANFTSIVNIDNFAHVGGFLCGLAMGLPLIPRMTSGRTRYLNRQKLLSGPLRSCWRCSATTSPTSNSAGRLAIDRPLDQKKSEAEAPPFQRCSDRSCCPFLTCKTSLAGLPAPTQGPTPGFVL